MIFATHSSPDEGCKAGFAIARVVADDREVAHAPCDQRIDESIGHTGGSKAADHHGGAVRNIRCRLNWGCKCLVDHRVLNPVGLAKRIAGWRQGRTPF